MRTSKRYKLDIEVWAEAGDLQAQLDQLMLALEEIFKDRYDAYGAPIQEDS